MLSYEVVQSFVRPHHVFSFFLLFLRFNPTRIHVQKLLASGETPPQGHAETSFIDACVADAVTIESGSGGGVEPAHGATAEADVEMNGAIKTDEHQKTSPLLQTCVECEDQHAELVCLSCEEPFCRPCWGSLHRYVTDQWLQPKHVILQAQHKQ